MHADLAALKFLALVERDLASGGLRPIERYLAEFPDDGALVVEEYQRLVGPDDTPEPTGQLASGRLLGGRYRVLASLGRGGFGEVYVAEDTALDRKVAVKVLAGLRALSPEWRDRLVREAAITGRIDDDGLCPVHDVGFEAGAPFLVMPWINGRSLDRLLADAAERASPPLVIPAQQSARGEHATLLLFVERLARTLHAAHQAGVVHRDVKPANILVRANGQPVLIDFGLAWLQDSDELRSRSGQLGTPVYTAPELSRDGAVPSPASDVYSLGVVLLECLTFQRPYPAERRPLAEPLPRLPRQFGAGLQAVVEAALAHDPAQRYQSAARLADDLRSLREGRDVSVRPAGTLRRLRTWLRAHTAAVALSLSLGTTLLVATVWGATAWTRHVEAQRAAGHAAAMRSELDTLLQAEGEAESLGGEVGERVQRATALLSNLRAQRSATPPNREVDRHFAAMCDAIAGLAIRQGDLELGRALAEEAVQLLRVLTGGPRPDHRDLASLAHALILVGDSWANDYAHETALASFREALALDERLLAAQPEHPTRVSNVGFGYLRIGRALRISAVDERAQAQPEALHSLLQGVDLLRRAADLDADDAARIGHLCDGLLEMAMSLQAWQVEPERCVALVEECDRLSLALCARRPNDAASWRVRAEVLRRFRLVRRVGHDGPSRSVEATAAARRAAALEPHEAANLLLLSWSLLEQAQSVLDDQDHHAAAGIVRDALQVLDRAFRPPRHYPAVTEVRLRANALLGDVAAVDGAHEELARHRQDGLALAASAWPIASPRSRLSLAGHLMMDWLATHGGARTLLTLERNYATPQGRRPRKLDAYLEQAAAMDR